MDAVIILDIHDLARGGLGVSRSDDGRVVFVPFTVPGDRVSARLVRQEKRYAEAQLVEILSPSPLRVKPRCPVFGSCGGCQWQHVPYELQWKTKLEGVLQTLRRAQIAIPDEVDTFPAQQIWEYRNRVQLRGDENSLGFYRSQTNELVPVDRCDIARHEINETWEQTRAEGKKLSRPFKVELEVLPSGEVSRTWNSSHSSHGFRQVNDEQNEKMKLWIYENLPEFEVLYDLFGGHGNLSLPLVNRFKEIHCIDLSVPKVKPEGSPAHYFFQCSSVGSWLSKRQPAVGRKIEPSAAILDPPREGLGNSWPQVADAFDRLEVQAFVAVGCDPDAWARDISKWIKRGWTLKRVLIIDLFPQTSHSESLALLTQDA